MLSIVLYTAAPLLQHGETALLLLEGIAKQGLDNLLRITAKWFSAMQAGRASQQGLTKLILSERNHLCFLYSNIFAQQP